MAGPQTVQEQPTASEERADGRHEATEAIHRIPSLLTELRDHVLYYVAVRVALIRARIRSAVLAVILFAFLLVAAAAAVVASITLLLLGAAHGLGQAFGGRIWLGDLVVGAIALVLMVLWLSSMFGGARRRAHELTVQQFEGLKAEQRLGLNRGDQERRASGRSDRNPNSPIPPSSQA